MKKYKEATYVVLGFSLQTCYFLPIGLKRVLHFIDSRMSKWSASVWAAKGSIYLYLAAWSHCCHGQGHRKKHKGDKQRGIHKWVWLNAPVDATSENMLFWCFGFIEMWFQFIHLPAGNWLSHCVRPGFPRIDIRVTAPSARLSPPLPQDSYVHHLSHIPGVQDW